MFMFEGPDVPAETGIKLAVPAETGLKLAVMAMVFGIACLICS
jgi:hypothetical protein